MPESSFNKDAGLTGFSHGFCEISKNDFFLQNTSGDCFCLVETGKDFASAITDISRLPSR